MKFKCKKCTLCDEKYVDREDLVIFECYKKRLITEQCENHFEIWGHYSFPPNCEKCGGEGWMYITEGENYSYEDIEDYRGDSYTRTICDLCEEEQEQYKKYVEEYKKDKDFWDRQLMIIFKCLIFA